MTDFNEYLTAKDSPLIRNEVGGYKFETQYEVQTNKLNASKINLTELVKRAGAAVQYGTLNAGSALNLSSSITYNQPKSAFKTFGHPQMTLYQGTTLTTANQIYPARGANVTIGRYQVQGDFDIHGYNGTADRWAGLLVDTTGTSSDVIAFRADWLYVDYVSKGIQ